MELLSIFGLNEKYLHRIGIAEASSSLRPKQKCNLLPTPLTPPFAPTSRHACRLSKLHMVYGYCLPANRAAEAGAAEKGQCDADRMAGFARCVSRGYRVCDRHPGCYREYLRGDTVRLKKYLYVLRPLLATLWIEQGRGIAPMPFQDLVDAIVTDPALLDAIDALLVIKRAAMESEYGQPLPVINAFIDTELTRLESVLPALSEPVDFSVLDRLLMNTVLGA